MNQAIPQRPQAGVRPRRANPLAPTALEIWSLLGVVAFYLLARDLFGESGVLTANLLGPLAMTGILALGAWRMVRVDGRNIWTALFWFRLSTAVYFGLGTFAVFVANNATRLYIETFYRFFDDDIFKMNLVVSASVVIVLTASRLVLNAMPPSPRSPRAAAAGLAGGRDIALIGALFCIAGSAVHYGLNVPHQFGWTTGQLPGSLLQLSRLTMVGIFLLTLWGLTRARWLLPFIAGLIAIELIFQLLLFAKFNFILTLMMFLLAFLWRKVTIARAALCAAVVSAAYVNLQPLVSYARLELASRHGENAQVGFGPRFDILTSYTPSDPKAVSAEDEVQGALSRISYVNAAALVIREYDDGVPGDWPELLPAVFVPRLLWPEKPVITDIGRDIYELGTGRRTSSSGAGVFADAYWAMGWPGVGVYMTVFGALLGVLTATASRLVRDGKWLFFPAVLMAMQMGFRTDGHYISDVAGAGVILAGMYAALSMLDMALRSRPPPISRPTAARVRAPGTR